MILITVGAGVSQSFPCSWDSFPPVRLPCFIVFCLLCLVVVSWGTVLFVCFACLFAFLKGDDRDKVDFGEKGPVSRRSRRRRNWPG